MSARVPISFVADVFGDDMRYEDDVPVRPDLAPGASQWVKNMRDQISFLAFVCPCGCGRVGSITARRSPDDCGWDWDGDVDRPTLTPSIQKTSPCRWHGFLIAGVFVQC